MDQIGLLHRWGTIAVEGPDAAQFLHAQRPHSTAYVVGGNGLASELYKVGYSITESNPEYVVVGKTSTFSFATMRKATQLIDSGAKFIGTNPDLIDPVEGGTELAYEVDASVGGKIAQLGSRLIDGFAKKMADEFFTRFQDALEGPEEGESDGEAAAEDAPKKGWFKRLIG